MRHASGFGTIASPVAGDLRPLTSFVAASAVLLAMAWTSHARALPAAPIVAPPALPIAPPHQQRAGADLPVVHKIAVFGIDNRTRLPRRLDALRSSIGMIYNDKTRTVCSAFCVADDVVATASHCVFRTKGETPPPPERFFFARPNTRHANVRFAGATGKSSAQQIMAGTIGISTKPPIDAARDWAFIKLQGPACKGKSLEILPLTPDEVEREAAADRVFQVAFHRDYGAWAIAYSGTCEAGRRTEGSGGPAPERDFTDPLNLVLHTCDTGGASSGSPLLVDTPDGPKVVAINVGTFVRSRVIIEEGVVVRRTPASPVANTAVSSVAFASRLEPFRRSTILTTSADLKELQQRLNAIALLQAPLSDRFDAKLRTAIELYEASTGQPVTGLPTRELMLHLQNGEAAVAPTNSRR